MGMMMRQTSREKRELVYERIGWLLPVSSKRELVHRGDGAAAASASKVAVPAV